MGSRSGSQTWTNKQHAQRISSNVPSRVRIRCTSWMETIHGWKLCLVRILWSLSFWCRMEATTMIGKHECDFCQTKLAKFEQNTRCFQCDLRYQLQRIAEALEHWRGMQWVLHFKFYATIVNCLCDSTKHITRILELWIGCVGLANNALVQLI